MSKFPPSGTSVSGASSSKFSSASQLSMLKKSMTQVYGAEAGIKPVTKNPWASAQTGNVGSSLNRKVLQGSTSAIQSKRAESAGRSGNQIDLKQFKKPQSTKNPIGNLTTTGVPIQLDSKRTFGAFDSICSKYQNSESQYQLGKKYAQVEVKGMETIRKIGSLAEAIQKKQRDEIAEETSLIAAQYQLFLSEENLTQKYDMLYRLSEYLKNVETMSDQFEATSATSHEQGNYVRIAFQGRPTFMDIIKQYSQLMKQEAPTEQMSDDENKLYQARKKALSSQQLNLFHLDNLVEFTEQAEKLLEIMKLQTGNRTNQLRELILSTNTL